MDQEVFKAELKDHVTETFSKVAGMYLDRGTSLLETLGSVDAELASRVHPKNGETVASHVFHLMFYQRVVREYVVGTNRERADWAQSWVVKGVTPDQWKSMLDDLRAEETQFQADASQWDWNDPEAVGAVLNMLQHCAFHLAAIRQILDVVR